MSDDPLDRIAHDELRDLDLTHLDDIARGWRKREYAITEEVRYACGEWLLQHSSDVLALVEVARAAWENAEKNPITYRLGDALARLDKGQP